MYTRTTTIIERSDIASILFYRWKDGAYAVTFTDCESIYTFTGRGQALQVQERGLYGTHWKCFNARLRYECNPVNVE